MKAFCNICVHIGIDRIVARQERKVANYVQHAAAFGEHNQVATGGGAHAHAPRGVTSFHLGSSADGNRHGHGIGMVTSDCAN